MFLLHIVAAITLCRSVPLKNQKSPEGSKEGLLGKEPGEATPRKGSAEQQRGRGGLFDRRPLAETDEGRRRPGKKPSTEPRRRAEGNEPRKKRNRQAQGSQDRTQRQEGTQEGPKKNTQQEPESIPTKRPKKKD